MTIEARAMERYIAPTVNLDGFHCPLCGVYAWQSWYDCQYSVTMDCRLPVKDIAVAICARCQNFTLWHGDTILYPSYGGAPMPHPDLFEGVRGEYGEARAIASLSPRSAAAILRMVFQKICRYLGESGKDLNADIDRLIERGLPAGLRKALQRVRVLGEDTANPGKIDGRDDAQTVATLFQIINIVIEKLVAEPKQISALIQTPLDRPADQFVITDDGKLE